MMMLREGLKSSPCAHLELARRTQSYGCYGSNRLKHVHGGRKDLLSISCVSACLLRCTRWVRAVPRRSSGTLSRVDLTLDKLENAGILVWADGVQSELPLSPVYLAKDLAPCLLDTGKAQGGLEATLLAHKILSELSYEIGHILTLPAAERAGRLDGLMDLSPPKNHQNHRRELRRRLHQALDNMVRWFLHAPEVNLADIHRDSVESLRAFSSMAIVRKRQQALPKQRSLLHQPSL